MLLGALERFFPSEAEWSQPDGGLFVWATLPPYINTTDLLAKALREDVAGLTETAELMGEALRDYLRRAAARGLETAVLKGLSVSVNVYGDPAMRPGGDVDLLVRREQVEENLVVLEEMGLGQWWPQ